MTITVKYDRKTIWGSLDYCEDVCYRATDKEVQKAIKFLEKRCDVAVLIEIDENTSYVLAWDGVDDCERGIVTFRTFKRHGYDDARMSFQKAKKSLKSILK